MLEVPLIIVIATTVLAQFSNPPAERVMWRIGEVQTIEFKTTFTEFSIALWQEVPEGGSANLGPVVFETTNNAAAKFDWIVQQYDFNLTNSNVFFFWMFEGASSLQGNQSSPRMSSPYFNVTDERPASNSSTAIPTATSNIPTTGIISHPTNTFEPVQNSQQCSDREGSTGISVGAKAGIGISVTIAGLIAILCTCAYMRHAKRLQQYITEPQNGNSHSIYQEEYRVKITPGNLIPQEMPTSANKQGPFELA
ncbi:hypothetical protein F4804DRAFT_349115 [Jackrogersella minutella]|nr:hypothetical protein F4804DRAFT_349115 [Jackrogersella minutella]